MTFIRRSTIKLVTVKKGKKARKEKFFQCDVVKEAINLSFIAFQLTSKVLILDRSSGITCFLFQVPHAYWKKSSHGSFVASIPASSDEAKKEKEKDKNEED